MVRDLSVPQSKSARSRKPEAKDVVPPDEGEVIPAHEVAAATTADILGKRSDGPAEKDGVRKNGDGKGADDKSAAARGDARPTGEPDEKTEEAKLEEVNVIGLPSTHKPKPAARKPKPITVASTPMIGNYQLPSHDFLQHPDPNIKPTESKEELMANARLMQQTLAQFDIEVSLGDITKGPDDHAIRIASRAGREAGKNHGAEQ